MFEVQNLKESLTYLAIALILALTAALAAPLFVDWTDYRAAIEAQLSNSLGAPVSTAGPIKLRFLPTPQIRLGVVAAGDRQTGPWLRAEGMRAEIQLSSLLRGEIRLSEAAFDRPLLEISIDAQDKLVLPLAAGRAESALRFDHFAVRDGTLVLRLPQGDMRFAGLTFEGEAQALTGPFNLRGEAAGAAPAADGGGAPPVKFNLAAGAVDKQRLRLKFGVELPALGGRADVDGALALDGGAGLQSVFEGVAAFSGVGLGAAAADAKGVAAAPWKMTGDLKAGLKGAVLENIDLKAGEGERGLSAGGEAKVMFGETPGAVIRLAARQLDMSKLGLLPAGAAPAAALDALLALIKGERLLLPLPLAIDASVSASIVTLGGEALSDLDLNIVRGAARQTQVSFSAKGPGRSSVALRGSLEPGIGAAFKGDFALNAPDAARLEAWFSGGTPDGWRRPELLAGFKAISAAGAVEIAATGFSGRGLTVSLDRTALSGALVYTTASAPEREKLFADFSSDLIDIDAMPDVSAFPAAAAGLDLSIALSSRAARIGRASGTAVELGRIAGKLTKAGETITLEQLTLANAAGASVSAAGSASPKGSHLEARVDAAQAADLAALTRSLAPGPWADLFAARARELANTRLLIKVDAAAPPAQGLPALAALSIDGFAGATRIAAAARPDGPGNLAVSLALDAPDAALMLRQLGWSAASAANYGAARLNLAARKRGELFENIAMDASVAGAALTYRGGAAQGKATLKSVNVAPLLQLLGFTGPDAAKSAAGSAGGDVTADMTVSGSEIAVQKLAGSLAGSKIDGRFAYRPGSGADAPRLTGALSLGRLSLAGLASLSLGPAGAVKPGAVWSEAAFGAGLVNPPQSEISLTAASFDVLAGLPGKDAAMLLRLSPGKVSVEDFSVSAGGGKIGGRFDLRRDGAAAALSGRLTLGGVNLTGPTLKGRLAGALDFASTGGSPLALAAGLAGTGEITLAPLQISGLDPLALKRVIDAAEAEKIVAAEQSVTSALASELDRAALTAASWRAPVTLAAGALRLGQTGLTELPARVEVSAAFDLRGFAFEMRAAVAALAAPKYWTGGPPQAAIVWKGVWPLLERQVDAAALVNGLAAAAIQRDSERLAAMDADIRERAYFNRRLKALEQERGRERQRVLLEQLAQDEEKRKALEAARALSDQLRRQEPRPAVAPPRGPVDSSSAESQSPRAN